MKKISVFLMVMTLCFCGTAYADLNDGLVAYYPFNGNINDESGNGNDGEVIGATLADDRFGNPKSAYNFTRKTDVIDIPDFNTPVISVSLWYFYQGNGDNWNSLICHDGVTYHHLLIDKVENKIGFFSGYSYQSSYFTIVKDVWYHIVLIKNNNNSKIYINNELVQSSDLSFNNSTYPVSRIGNCGREVDQGSLGIIDDVRIYNRDLSKTEIQELYNGSTPIQPTSYSQKELDDAVEAAKRDGMDSCKADPVSCGIETIDRFTQADLDAKYQKGLEDGKATCEEDPVCTQVVIYGKAPNIDCWIEFPTVCDVPKGWETVTEKPENMCGSSDCPNCPNLCDDTPAPLDNDGCASFNFFDSTLYIPCFDAGKDSYWLELGIILGDPIMFDLKGAGINE